MSFVLGAYAVIAQSILVREFLVVSFGNEISWGIAFFGWLLGLALGAAAGGWAGRRWDPTLLLGRALCVLVFVTPACVFLIRVSRGFFDVGPGEYLPLWSMLWLYPLLTLPISFIVGFAFPLASSLAGVAHPPSGEASPSQKQQSHPGAGVPHKKEGTASPIANVYAAEALGAMVGGALFSFVLVDHVPAFALMGYSGTVAISAACFLAVGSSIQNPKSKTQNAFFLLAPPVIFAAATLILSPRLENASVERRWQTFATGTRIIRPFPVDSRYQNITLAKRENEYSVFLDGLKTMTFPDPVEHAQDANFVMCEAKNVRRILLIGGGMEGPLAEMLKYPVERIDYVTLDPKLVDLVRPYLPPADRAALEDPRVHVHYEDGIRFLARSWERTPKPKYDLVWLNVPEPGSLLMRRYYSQQSVYEAWVAMDDNGLLALRLTASAGYFDDMQKRYLASVVVPVQGFFHNWLATWGEQSFILASREDGVFTADGGELARRYRERGVKSSNFDPAWFEGATDMLTPANLAKIRGAIEQGIREDETREGNASDLGPYLYRMILDERVRTGGSASFLEWIVRLRLWHAVLASLGVFLFWMAASRWVLRRSFAGSATTFSVATTGFAGMALSLILLVEFQDALGYVYAQVGLFIGTFMFGLVAGSLYMKRRLRSDPGLGTSSLGGLDLLFAGVCFFLIFVIGLVFWMSRRSDAASVVFLVLFFGFGVFGGLIFPLAARIAIGSGQTTGRAAASVTVADNLGACAGALLAGVVLFPALGMGGTWLLLVFLKLLSGTMLLVASRVGRRA